MYIPKHFAEPRVDVLHQLIRACPLSTLVTLSSSGLNANHIPLHLSKQPSPFGTLRGHVARANPIWNDIAQDVEVLGNTEQVVNDFPVIESEVEIDSPKEQE